MPTPPPERGVLLRFFLVLFAGAMVLGPLIYFVLHRWVPFHRAMDRALLISALGALAVAWPRLKFRQWWPWRRSAVLDVLFGLLVALLSVQTILALEVGFGGLAWAPVDPHDRGKIVALALVAAVLVPLAEETIFRGFLQTEIARKLGANGGWLLTAAIFVLVHFLKIPDNLDHQPVHWWSGPGAIGAAFLPIIHGWFLSGRGLNLLIIGLILGGIFRRTGTLWFNYGLHGGWIFGLLLAIKLTHSTGASFWTGDDLLGSPLTGIVLAVLGWWLWRFYRRPQPESGSTAP